MVNLIQVRLSSAIGFGVLNVCTTVPVSTSQVVTSANSKKLSQTRYISLQVFKNFSLWVSELADSLIYIRQ